MIPLADQAQPLAAAAAQAAAPVAVTFAASLDPGGD